jgi:hypothetical protein
MDITYAMCIKGDIMAMIEGHEKAKYIKQAPSTRRILEESIINNYSIRPYVKYLQFKHQMKKKRLLLKNPDLIISKNG